MHRSADIDIVAMINEPVWEVVALCALPVVLFATSARVYVQRLRSAASCNQVDLVDSYVC